MPPTTAVPHPRRWRSLRLLCLVSSLALGSAFACSGETTPRGQIMVALQTDMSLPKDVDRIRVQVLQNGNFKFDKTYPVGGPNDEKIPATLGIVGDDSAEPVEVRVLGFRGEQVRTLSKTITTVPETRIALLRVPIQWLCEGMAEEVAPDTYETTCPPEDGQETACVAGGCEPVEKDSGRLPDFAPGAVFGGGNGRDGGGTCFTTETCFDQGFDVTPNMTDCTAEVMAGENEPLNFALRTSGQSGDGICSGPNCYVPLDRDDEFGWRDPSGAQSGGQAGRDVVDAGAEPGPVVLRNVELPSGVCERIADGRAAGLRASTRCPTKTPEVPTCGPWSSVGNGPSGGADGGIEPSQCPAFVPGQTLGPVSGEPLLDAYLQAAADLKMRAEQLKGNAGTACANAVTALGGQTNIANPPSDSDVMQVCGDASRLLNENGYGNYPVLVSPAVCTSAVADQLDCETTCAGANCAPELDRCALPTGPCTGDCLGSCIGGLDTVVSCAGRCSARCQGTCQGTCTMLNGEGQCDGMCDGICTGTCDGACESSGPCDGTCQALLGAPGTACSGTIEASDFCGLPLEPESCGAAPCAELCAAQAGLAQSCTMTSAGIDAAAPSELRSAVTASRAPLTDAAIQAEALRRAADYLSFATQGLAATSSGQGAVCLNVASQAAGEAAVSLDTLLEAITPIVKFEGAGVPDAGGGLDSGPLPDGGDSCLPAGANPLIDDFEDGNPTMLPNDGRSGTWSFGADPSGTLDEGAITALPMQRGGSITGAHVMAAGCTEWGATMIAPFSPGSCYDASNWDGLAFWSMTPAASTLSVRVFTTDSVTACTPSLGSNCSFYTQVATGSTWTQHQLTWAAFTQWDGDKPEPVFDPSTILGIEIVQPTSEVDFWVDDVGFEGVP